MRRKILLIIVIFFLTLFLHFSNASAGEQSFTYNPSKSHLIKSFLNDCLTAFNSNYSSMSGLEKFGKQSLLSSMMDKTGVSGTSNMINHEENIELIINHPSDDLYVITVKSPDQPVQAQPAEHPSDNSAIESSNEPVPIPVTPVERGKKRVVFNDWFDGLKVYEKKGEIETLLDVGDFPDQRRYVDLTPGNHNLHFLWQGREGGGSETNEMQGWNPQHKTVTTHFAVYQVKKESNLIVNVPPDIKPPLKKSVHSKKPAISNTLPKEIEVSLPPGNEWKVDSWEVQKERRSWP